MNILEVKNLSYRWDPRKTDGINNINFSIKKGEILSLIGPSGSGKTTTLKCISGKLKAEGILFHEDVSISVIDQNPKLEEQESVFLNLEKQISHIEDPTKRENQIRTTLSLLEITNEINSPVAQLSGGQRQRLVLGMALVTNPTLLLLDEPFANLDKNLRELLLNELWDVFREKEISVIWVTHNTEEALKYSDRLVLLNFGEIQQIGSAKELFLKPNNIFVAQFFGENNILAAKKVTNESFELLGKEIITQTSLPSVEDFLVVLRPHFFSVESGSKLQVKIEHIYFMGSKQLIQVSYKETKLYIELNSMEEVELGQKLAIEFNAQHISILSTC